MSISKKSRFRTFCLVIAIATACVTVALVFQSHRPEKNISQNAGTAFPSQISGGASLPADAARAVAAQPMPLAAAAGAGEQQRLLEAATGAQRAQPHTPVAASAPAFADAAVVSGGAANVDTAAALAALSQRERAVFEKIPSERFRNDVLALAPVARVRVLKNLAANPVPAADYASLHVTSKGMLYYVCQLLPVNTGSHDIASEAISAGGAAPDVLAAPVPITRQPARHSHPGARHVLFLDFGGMDIAGTAWNEKIDGRAAVATYRARPYDIDGDSATFSEQEQKNIIRIWEAVAEDFAPFDVDVTTEKPAVFTRTTGRALITRSVDENGTTMPSGDKAGGVALRNVFGEPEYVADYSPAFIYYDNLASVDNIAYAVSHELGHNLGLSHDGPGADTAAEENGYYLGHGYGNISWAPIMGAGYGRTIVQWSKGDYYKANNHEDDLAIIAGKVGYRGNLAAGGLATAASLVPLESGLLGANGIIRNAGDTHYYTFTLSSPASINFSLEPCRLSGTGAIVGNADLKLEFLDSDGNVGATLAPTTETNVAIGRNLASGKWYLRISSEGTGTPMSIMPTGYAAYGSIGQYALGTNLVYTRPALASALNSVLTWRNEPGSDAGWFGQTTTSHDGVSAAQSGTVGQGQSAGIVSTVEGSGTLSFWWKISAGASDYLSFASTDAISGSTAILAAISGERNWEQRTLAINATGTHHFGWTFDKALATANPDPADTSGSAWVDQVVWTPADFTFNTTPATMEALPGSGTFALAIETGKTWIATADVDWLALSATTGSGNATLGVAHLPNNTPAPRRGAITIASAGINRVCEVAQPALVGFSTALNNSFTWETGGDSKWITQNITTHDGQHAARSGIIFGVVTPTGALTDTGQETWLKTTVQGPGTVSFWWKVSSEEEASDETGVWGDILYFYIDGQERARTSGEKDWAPRSFVVTGTGAYELKWRYKKDPYLAVGADGAWLDQVTWTTGTASTLTISPVSRQASAGSGQFEISVDSNVAWNASSSAAWLSVSPSSGIGAGTLNVSFANNTGTAARTGTITVAGGSLTDTCVITQAGVTTTGTGGNNNDNNNNNNNSGGGGGGGGGGAASVWSLLALGALLGVRLGLRLRAGAAS